MNDSNVHVREMIPIANMDDMILFMNEIRMRRMGDETEECDETDG